MGDRRTKLRLPLFVRLSELVYAALLVATYPKHFRAAYGEDMREMFRDRCADRLRRRGLLGLPGMWANTLVDAFRHGAAARRGGIGRKARFGRSGVLAGDLSFALRSLRKSPAFTLVALVTLALGIGANTAVFSVIDAALLAELPYPDAEELFMVWRYDTPDSRTTAFSYPDIRDIQDSVETFSALSPFDNASMIVADGVDGRRVSGAQVPEDFFDVLGVAPLFGRAIRADDQTPGSERVVVLGHTLWESRFGGNPAVVGTTIRVNSRPATVVGVMPAGFSFPPGAEAWTALPPDENRGGHWLRAIGRVAPRYTAEQAEAEVSGIIARLEQEYPGRYQNNVARLGSLREQFVGNLRPTLLILAPTVCRTANSLFLRSMIMAEKENAETIAAMREVAYIIVSNPGIP